MKVNTNTKSNIGAVLTWGYTPLFGGISSCAVRLTPSVAAAGININSVEIMTMWEVSGSMISYLDEYMPLTNTDGYVVTIDQSIAMGITPTTQACELVFHVLVSTSAGLVFFVHHTGVLNASAPVKSIANPPSPVPVALGSLASANCSWDVAGLNTTYEAVFSSIDGLTTHAKSAQTSTLFTDSVSSLVDSNGQVKWKSRAINSTGTGEWSDWCTFQCFQPIAGTLSYSTASTGRFTHSVSASLSISSGHTPSLYDWRLLRNSGGVWYQVNASLTENASITWTGKQNDQYGAYYKIQVLVIASKYGVQSSQSFSGYSCFPDIISVS
jgi:hypothetical protein